MIVILERFLLVDPEVEQLFRRELDFLQEVLEPESVEIAFISKFLADAHVEQKKYKEAEPLVQQALTIYRHVFEEEKGALVQAGASSFQPWVRRERSLKAREERQRCVVHKEVLEAVQAFCCSQAGSAGSRLRARSGNIALTRRLGSA